MMRSFFVIFHRWNVRVSYIIVEYILKMKSTYTHILVRYCAKTPTNYVRWDGHNLALKQILYGKG